MNEQSRYQGRTSFKTIYDSFLSLITDDMYMEWSAEETYADLKNIFLSSLSNFEFPRFRLYDYETVEDVVTGEDRAGESFNFILTNEEVKIFAHLMMIDWLNRQLASVDVVRQKYSSRDFEFTSQANHLAKLVSLKDSFIKESIRLQRLYTRRKMNDDGYFVPNYQGFGGKR